MSNFVCKKRKGAIAKIRNKFSSDACFELLAYLSGRNVYGQVVDLRDRRVLFSVSSVSGDKKVNKRNVKSAEIVGKSLALKCKEHGIKDVVFNRANYKFCAVVGSLAKGFYSNVD